MAHGARMGMLAEFGDNHAIPKRAIGALAYDYTEELHAPSA